MAMETGDHKKSSHSSDGRTALQDLELFALDRQGNRVELDANKLALLLEQKASNRGGRYGWPQLALVAIAATLGVVGLQSYLDTFVFGRGLGNNLVQQAVIVGGLALGTIATLALNWANGIDREVDDALVQADNIIAKLDAELDD